jgi:hypothetical protein
VRKSAALLAILAAAACSGHSSTAGDAPEAGNGCTSDQIHVGTHPLSGAGGHFYWAVQFTNDSNSKCTVQGYPRITFLRHGTQLGRDARQAIVGSPDTSDSPRLIALHAGDTAHSVLRIDNPAVPDPPCHRVRPTGMQVSLPGWPAARVMPSPVRAICLHSRAAIGPVRSGALPD